MNNTGVKGENNTSAKLTDEQAREIYALKGQASRFQIAQKFGVSQTTVKRIHRKQSWTHIHNESNQSLFF